MSVNKKIIETEATPPPPDNAFNILQWTGNNTTNNQTGAGFNPDLIWCRDFGGATNGSNAPRVVDTTRGLNSLYMATTNAQSNEYGYNFLNDGIQLTNSNSGWNRTGNTYRGYMWRANGGTTVNNTDGSITSQIQANTDTGFSIVKYTGTGSASATVGHGLNQAPEFIIAKSYSWANDWGVYMDDGTDHIFGYIGANATTTMNINYASAGGNQVGPVTSTYFTTSHIGTNNSGQNFITYCWHSVPGYSKIGSYTTGASTKITLGFQPDFIIFRYVVNGEWYVQDIKQWDGSSYGSNGGKLIKAYWMMNQYSVPTPVSTGGVEIVSDGFYPTNWFRYWSSPAQGVFYAAFKIQP